MTALTVGHDIGHGCTLVAYVPVWDGGPLGTEGVITAWRERDAVFVTWAVSSDPAFIADGAPFILWRGHYGILTQAEAIADMLTRAGYSREPAGKHHKS